MSTVAKTDDEWMLFNEAVDSLLVKYGRRHDAANALKGKGGTDTLKSIAGGAAEIPVADYSGKGAISHLHRDWPIPPDVWQGVKDFDPLLKSWANSTFTSILGMGPYKWRAVQLSEVKVDRATVNEMLAALPDREIDFMEREVGWIARTQDLEDRARLVSPETTASPHSDKDKGGSPLDSEKWANFVGVLAGYLSRAEIVEDMKAGALYSKLSEYAALIGVQIPSKTTCDAALKRAVKWSAAPHHASGRPLQSADGQPLTLD